MGRERLYSIVSTLGELHQGRRVCHYGPMSAAHHPPVCNSQGVSKTLCARYSQAADFRGVASYSRSSYREHSDLLPPLFMGLDARNGIKSDVNGGDVEAGQEYREPRGGW
jgi:hypothetical protein